MHNVEVIYKKYSKKIFNLAYRMTGNIDDAHDVTQETFIQVLQSIDKFKGDSHVYTWLYKIAKNNCIRHLKKKNKPTFVSLQELIYKESSPFSEEISEKEKALYITQVKDGCLSGLLRCLSLQQRLAFILNVLLDLPCEQVASVIDKSENATRILIHRAKQNIKDFLCNNCSLYDSKNTCHCENLINFSLKQNWISLDNASNISTIETEIKNLKDVVRLYKTIQEPQLKDEPGTAIKQLLAQKDNMQILNSKKVK